MLGPRSGPYGQCPDVPPDFAVKSILRAASPSQGRGDRPSDAGVVAYQAKMLDRPVAIAVLKEVEGQERVGLGLLNLRCGRLEQGRRGNLRRK